VPLRPAYRLAVDYCASNYPFSLSYQGLPLSHWQALWSGPGHDAARRDEHMVSEYALIDAWEWQAEYSAAYALNLVAEAAERLCTHQQARELKRRLRRDLKQEWTYLAENAPGLAAYDTVIAGQFPDPADPVWDEAARLFLLASYPDVCP